MAHFNLCMEFENFWAKCLLLMYCESAIEYFFPKSVPRSVQVLFHVDKLDCLKNPSLDSFCFETLCMNCWKTKFESFLFSRVQSDEITVCTDWVSNLTLSEARDRFSLFSVLAMPIQKKCLIRDDRDKLPHRLHPPVDQIYS